MKYLSILLLASIVFITYINSLSGAFVLDDIEIIEKNRVIGDFSHIVRHPLESGRQLTLFLTFSLFGATPVPFHVVNILFHTGNVILIFFMVKILVDKRAAWFAAALSAVHPILAESVSWISGGAYPQYTFFLLISLLLLILHTKHKSKNSPIFYPGSLLFAVFAFASSDKALALPFIFLAYLISFTNIRKTWIKIIPYAALGAIWITYYIMRIGARIAEVKQAHYEESVSVNPLMQVPVAISSYLQLLVWPAGLSVYHTDFIMTPIIFGLRVLVCLIYAGALIYFFIKNKPVFFFLIAFLLSLITTLTPLGISSIVTERYAYLGSLFIFCAVGYGLWQLSKQQSLQMAVYTIFGVIVLGLMVRTIVRNTDWRTTDSLYIATGKTSVYDPATHLNLGDVYRKQGRFQESEKEFKAALELNPNYADAYNNLGVLYLDMGNPDRAIEHYQKALQINPDLWEAYEGMAIAYGAKNDIQAALKNLQKAASLKPDDAPLQSNLGVAYLKLGDSENARRAFMKALELDPEDQKAKLGLAELNNL